MIQHSLQHRHTILQLDLLIKVQTELFTALLSCYMFERIKVIIYYAFYHRFGLKETAAIDLALCMQSRGQV